MPEDIDSHSLTLSHIPLALEAAHKSIVLLENRNSTLPLQLSAQNIQKIAVVGPFADTFNFGSYTGKWGANPTDRASTIRQGLLEHLAKAGLDSIQLVSAWGAKSWNYNVQYPIPGYLLSANGSTGGLHATYYHDTSFQQEAFERVEPPNRDWGLYPPVGLSSTSFGVVWEGELEVPVSSKVHGSIGVSVLSKTIARLYIDGKLVSQADGSANTVLREIQSYTYTAEKGRDLPPGGVDFVFTPGAKHHIRLECEVHPDWPRPSAAGVHSRVYLWWNLVDRKDSVAQVNQWLG
jgi:hypothetical protein